MSDQKHKGYYSLPEALLLGRNSMVRAKKEYDEGLSAGLRLGGFPEMADLFPAGKESQLVSVIGHSGHYKSTIANMMSMSRVDQIIADGDTNRVVVFVSVEETVGRLALRLFAHYTGASITDLSMGRFSHEVLAEIDGNAMAKLSGLPIFLIAPSDGESREQTTGKITIKRSSTTGMTLEGVEDTLLHLANDIGLQIDSLFFDYYQILPSYDGSSQKSFIKNEQNVAWAIDISRSFGCTTVLLAQAHKETHNIKHFPLDRYSAFDGQVIGHRSDIVYTLCNVTKLVEPYEVLEGIPGYPQLEVEEGLFLLTVAKSKISEELTVPLIVDPATMRYKFSRQYFKSEAAYARGHKYNEATHNVWA